MSKHFCQLILGTAIILLIPLVFMQFTTEVNWDARDFAFAGVLILGAGTLHELIVRRIKNCTGRSLAGAVVIGALALVWLQAAVGLL